MPVWLIITILGIVEGITEFLPISSTGHLLITEKLIGTHQSDLFNVVIQCGAVIAVIPLFWKTRIEKFIFGLGDPANKSYLAKLIVAFGITAAGGLVLVKTGFKLPTELAPVGWALLIGGILFVAVEMSLRGKKLGNEVTWTIAVAVGVGQLIAAVFPGASRSGTTILISLLLGLSRPVATEFSFLVSIPTMLAAGASQIHKAMKHPVAGAPHEDWAMVIVATVIAAVVSFIAVKWLLRYVQSHTFIGFGWYRIVVGVAILGYVFMPHQ